MTKNNRPLVSVVIPAYNCEEYIAESVESILNQTYNNIEILAVDDGSTDDTLKILSAIQQRDKRLYILKNPKNLKIVGTLNRALDESRGKYIARMDGDDYKYPDAIEKQVAYLEKHPDTIVVGGAINICDSRMKIINKREYPLTDAAIRKHIFRFNPFAHPAVMINADLMGAERYSLNWAEDYDMWFKLGSKGKLANLDDIVLNLRTHADSVSQSKLVTQEKLTLYIRLKAVFEYGYRMSFVDKVYFFLQLMGLRLLPAGIKFKLFNLIRRSRG